MTSQTVGLTNAGPQPSLLEAQPLAKPRLAYLDNLRTTLITLVVLGHLSVTYGIDADWYYYEGGEVSQIASTLGLMAVVIIISFAMGLFFLIAGYFTPPAYDRKGTRRFLAGRLKRLGIPWLLFEVFLNPLIHYAVDVHGGDCTGSFYDCQFQGTFWQYLIEYPRNIGSIASSPVWFLEALLIFSVFYALWRMVAKPAPLPAPSAPGQAHAAPSNGAIALFALFIGLATFVVRFWARVLVQYEPLHLEFARFPQYAALFVAGVWAYRRGWLVTFPDRRARVWRWVALVCVVALPALLVAFGALSGTIDERFGGGMNGLSLIASLWEGFLCVSIAIIVVTWFRHRFDHQGRMARAMSESSFAVYVLHPAIIVPLALALSGIHMNLGLKFLWVAPVAVALCYLVAYALRRVPVARTILG